jgi:hypothetical protein
MGVFWSWSVPFGEKKNLVLIGIRTQDVKPAAVAVVSCVALH